MPREISEMADPSSVARAKAIGWYIKAYRQGWMDSAAHYEIDEFMEEEEAKKKKP